MPWCLPTHCVWQRLTVLLEIWTNMENSCPVYWATQQLILILYFTLIWRISNFTQVGSAKLPQCPNFGYQHPDNIWHWAAVEPTSAQWRTGTLVGIVEAKVATNLHPAALQWASVSKEGVGSRPAPSSYQMALDCQPSLCHWSRQCGPIRLPAGV